MKRSSIHALLFGALSFLFVLMPVSVQADTQFYFLRHVEVHMDDPDKPLTDEGKQRARVLAEHMKGKKITHIYATHFDRNLDTVVHLAKDQGLEVIRVPKPGSIVDGDEVTNRSKGKIATEPMINALNEVPDGSAVVVSANSGNLFKIMAGVGVESGSDDMPCESKRCFPRDEFHNIWLVTKTGDGITLQKSQY